MATVAIDVQIYRALALKHGLILYDKTGMKPNTQWTPTAMLKAATGFTGTVYKRGQYLKAATDLDLWLQEARREW